LACQNPALARIRKISVVRASGTASCGEHFLDVQIDLVQITVIDLVRCATEPTAVGRVLGAVGDGMVERTQACDMLSCSPERLELLLSSGQGGEESSQGRKRKELATQARTIQGLPARRSRQRSPHISTSDLAALADSEASVNVRAGFACVSKWSF
jgi:hypothetical protein